MDPSMGSMITGDPITKIGKSSPTDVVLGNCSAAIQQLSSQLRQKRAVTCDNSTPHWFHFLFRRQM
jgi:hypothetical protein